MKFFFPDAHDFVDPGYDFVRDRESAGRQRQQDDAYAHEALGSAPYDGLLVSRSVVEGTAGRSGKYTKPQRHRLYREGVHAFFRLPRPAGPGAEPFPVMGDCGAFSYVAEERPPITIHQAIEFYATCGFTHGQSVDHIIGKFRPEWGNEDGQLIMGGPPPDVRRRYDLTLSLAADFIGEHRRLGCTFVPVAVAQGWSAESYAEAVERFQDLGYDFIALGGLVPLKTPQLMSVVRGVMPRVRRGVKIHLLGVLRWECLDELLGMGIYSFDTTSPMRQAFLDSNANYHLDHADTEPYIAIRVPQSDGNPRVKALVRSGQYAQEGVRRLESACLDGLRALDRDPAAMPVDDLLDLLDTYVGMLDPDSNWRAKHERLLRDQPWRACECPVCRALGVEVVIFRGNDRNRRRGFHNLYVSYRRLQAALERRACPTP